MLWWFAETTLIAGLLACVAALIGRLRTVGPTARHVLWLVVLIKLVTPPVIRSPWPVPWPEAWSPVADDRPLADSPSRQHSPAPMLRPNSPPQAVRDEAGPAALAAEASTGDVIAEPRIAKPLADVKPKDTSQGRWTLRLPAGSAGQWLLVAWTAGGLALALVQGYRIIRFQRRLREAVPAPAWLVDEADRIGARLGVRVPEILAVPSLGTPMLWCLGQPKLLIPCRLMKSVEVARWRGVLAHELAHLARGDQWVGRLELVASFLWWWNPLYWLTRRRLDTEAELACDAWVVWALPDDRLTYAQVLFQICSDVSLVPKPAPALGVAGSGRFFERRLTMILRDRVSCRTSPLVLLAAALLALLALPSWTLARPTAIALPNREPSAALEFFSDDPPASQVSDDADDEDGDDADADDDADDDDDAKTAEKPRGKTKSSQKAKAKEHKGKKAEKDDDIDVDVDVSGIERQIEAALGPDFEKKIEQWAEKFAKDIENKFGDDSEFAKKMEAFGKEMEKKFGDDSEFAKKMETMGKDMEKKFGPGSDFEKKMKALGKDMEKKFGPGSDFERKMKEKFGPGSDFEKKIKEEVEAAEATAKEHKAKAKEQVAKAKEQVAKARQQAELREKSARSAGSRAGRREQRVKALEARIEALMKELKALKEADDEDEKSEDKSE